MILSIRSFIASRARLMTLMVMACFVGQGLAQSQDGNYFAKKQQIVDKVAAEAAKSFANKDLSLASKYEMVINKAFEQYWKDVEIQRTFRYDTLDVLNQIIHELDSLITLNNSRINVVEDSISWYSGNLKSIGVRLRENREGRNTALENKLNSLRRDYIAKKDSVAFMEDDLKDIQVELDSLTNFVIPDRQNEKEALERELRELDLKLASAEKTQKKIQGKTEELNTLAKTLESMWTHANKQENIQLDRVAINTAIADYKKNVATMKTLEPTKQKELEEKVDDLTNYLALQESMQKVIEQLSGKYDEETIRKTAIELQQKAELCLPRYIRNKKDYEQVRLALENIGNARAALKQFIDKILDEITCISDESDRKYLMEETQLFTQEIRNFEPNGLFYSIYYVSLNKTVEKLRVDLGVNAKLSQLNTEDKFKAYLANIKNSF